MAARHAEVTETGRRWRERNAPASTAIELACAGGGPTMAVRLIDLSTFGCRVGGDGAESVGDHVRLSFGDRAPVSATVIWRREGALGCRFDKPIATSMMRQLICGEA